MILCATINKKNITTTSQLQDNKKDVGENYFVVYTKGNTKCSLSSRKVLQSSITRY